MLPEQRAVIPALDTSTQPTNPSRCNTPAWLFSAECLCVVLATGRARMLLNNLRVAPEHLSNHGNTDAIPKGKLRSIYLQNTVVVCIIPFLRREMLDYPYRQQSGPCIPKAAWGIQEIRWSHSLAQAHGSRRKRRKVDVWLLQESSTEAASQNLRTWSEVTPGNQNSFIHDLCRIITG